MKRFYKMLILTTALFCATQTGFGQETHSDTLSVPFSDPSRSGMITVTVMSGSITVEGHDEKHVFIESRARVRERHDNRRKDGLRLIPNTSAGLKVEEEDNEMKIHTNSWSRRSDLFIKAPRKVSMKLQTMNSGKLIIENIEGEIEANNMNGSIHMDGISGTVVAHSANGKVVVAFDKITPEKPMSFISMNGTIDVTFPANAKLDAKMRTDHGEIYTDFDIEMQRNVRKEERNRERGRYSITVDKEMFGRINGGGPEMQFRTMNGNIYIRKKE